MIVRELIAELSKLDPETPVLVDGYEGGQDFPIIRRRKAWRRAEPGGYFGEFDVDEGPDEAPADAEDVVVLHRPPVTD